MKEEMIKIADLKVHELANFNPMMEKEEFDALVESIKDMGQQEPIKVYRKQIIDGRNRVKALEKLGIDEVRCQIMPHKTKIEELRKIANATEVRRHQTPTQLAIKAYRLSKDASISMKEAAKAVGVSESSVKLVSKLNKLKPVLLNDLQNGNKYKTMTGYATDSLRNIINDIEKENDNRLLTNKDIEEMRENATKEIDDNSILKDLEKKLEYFISMTGLTDEEISLLPEALQNITADRFPSVLIGNDN